MIRFERNAMWAHIDVEDGSALVRARLAGDFSTAGYDALHVDENLAMFRRPLTDMRHLRNELELLSALETAGANNVLPKRAPAVARPVKRRLKRSWLVAFDAIRSAGIGWDEISASIDTTPAKAPMRTSMFRIHTGILSTARADGRTNFEVHTSIVADTERTLSKSLSARVNRALRGAGYTIPAKGPISKVVRGPAAALRECRAVEALLTQKLLERP